MDRPLHSRLPQSVVHAALLGVLAFPAAAQDPTTPAKPKAPPGEVASTAPIPAPLGDVIPELAKQSSWAQNANFGSTGPRGPYPVGNGRAFGVLGLGARANTLQAITGPHYALDDPRSKTGHFGSTTLELRRNGAEVALPNQRVRRVSGAGFVVTEDAADQGLLLRTTTFATPGATHLVQVVEVINGGTETIDGTSLRLTTDGEATTDGNSLRKVYHSKTQPCGLRIAMTGAKAVGQGLESSIPPLAAGAKWRGVVWLATHDGVTLPEGLRVEPSLETAINDARATKTWWTERLAETPVLDSDHAKVRDLVADGKVLLLTQTCADARLATTMLGRREFHVREAAGPLLLLLRSNLWGEAKRYLEVIAHAVARDQRVPTTISLAAASSDGTKPADLSKVDWKKVRVAPGDIPSWVILYHLWYWRVTQDTALIERHWPLLEICLKRQRRGPDNLLRFHGDENYMSAPLSSLYPEQIGIGNGLIANSPTIGRRSYSFASGTLFLLSMHALGDLLDGIDKSRNPAKWAEGAPKKRPGARYVEHTFQIMSDIEKRFWLEEQKMFAPAISPVTQEPHATPVANANLMPLWVGWTFPTGEKSRDNLRTTLELLWRADARIGSTPAVGHVTGEVQGMLVAALAERDATRRLDALDAMLAMAEPAGTYASIYGPNGRPTDGADRGSMFASGINIDALMFAISGVRFVAVPNWDNTDVRLELRLPTNAKFVTMKNVRKDGRELSIFFRETFEKMTKTELEDNSKQTDESKRRDPNEKHRRLRFRVELLSDNPAQGYYDAAINAATTVFVRYLTKEKPTAEVEFWAPDREPFLPHGMQPPRAGRKPLAATEGATMLVLTARPATAELLDGDKVTLVDSGLPWRAGEVRDLLVGKDGKPAHESLYLDWGHNLPTTATYRPKSFWSGAEWQDVIRSFEAAGGKVLRPQFATKGTLESNGKAATEVAATADGGLRFDYQDPGKLTVVFQADKTGERVLRIGSSHGMKASWNGKRLYEHKGERSAVPDSDNELVKVQAGDNTLVLEIRGSGMVTVFARLTDSRGM